MTVMLHAAWSVLYPLVQFCPFTDLWGLFCKYCIKTPYDSTRSVWHKAHLNGSVKPYQSPAFLKTKTCARIRKEKEKKKKRKKREGLKNPQTPNSNTHTPPPNKGDLITTVMEENQMKQPIMWEQLSWPVQDPCAQALWLEFVPHFNIQHFKQHQLKSRYD